MALQCHETFLFFPEETSSFDYENATYLDSIAKIFTFENEQEQKECTKLSKSFAWQRREMRSVIRLPGSFSGDDMSTSVYWALFSKRKNKKQNNKRNNNQQINSWIPLNCTAKATAVQYRTATNSKTVCMSDCAAILECRDTYRVVFACFLVFYRGLYLLCENDRKLE